MSLWQHLWQQWLPRLRREKHLLTELLLMTLVALVVGLYFLEHFSSRLETWQQTHLKALAQQTALRSAESLASGDRIGLNVIARETRALDTVTGVRFRDPAGRIVTDNVNAHHAVSVAVPVALPSGELAGSVVLFAADSGAVRDPLESGYVLVVLGLLVLRVAAALIGRRLRRPGTGDGGPAILPATGGDAAPEGGASRSAGAGPGAATETTWTLHLSIVNFEHFQQRYTAGALAALLADYRELLQQVVALHGGVVEQDIGAHCRVCFRDVSLSRASFSALCAGLLFLRVARLQGPRRKARSAPALEFKALVSDQFDDGESRALCVAGVPGRLQVPESDLTRAELDVKAFYQTERAVVVSAAERQVRLQPIEQLAHRYQTLLRTQAEQVMADDGSEPVTES